MGDAWHMTQYLLRGFDVLLLGVNVSVTVYLLTRYFLQRKENRKLAANSKYPGIADGGEASLALLCFIAAIATAITAFMTFLVFYNA